MSNLLVSTVFLNGIVVRQSEDYETLGTTIPVEIQDQEGDDNPPTPASEGRGNQGKEKPISDLVVR